MKAVACMIKCECGGHVEVLPEDGAYYTLTESLTVIFMGRCGKCFELVRVERLIAELMVHCPSTDKHVN